jgi:hypothetical protein
MILLGKDVEGKEVCHHCDNPQCCNPNHLFVGTHEENMRDAAEKGRLSQPGEENPNAKLSDKERVEIKARYEIEDTTYRDLAEEYGVHHTLIGYIINGGE